MGLGGGTYVFNNLEGIYVSPDRRYMIFLCITNMQPHSSLLSYLLYSIESDPIKSLSCEVKPVREEDSNEYPFSGGLIADVDFWSTAANPSDFIMQTDYEDGRRKYVLFEWM